MHEVKVGQVWRDLDKRMTGRTIKIDVILNDKDGKPEYAKYRNGKAGTIRVDRLRKPFFELVS